MGSAYQAFDAPLPQLLSVRATTALADGQPQRTPLDGGGGTTVLSTASFILKFDRFLLPSTATRQSVCLWSDLSVDVRTVEDCQSVSGEVRVFLEPTYNPVEREVILRRSPDQPRLAPGTRYRLAVLAPTGPDDPYGIRAFDSAPLAQTVQIEFTVTAEDPPGTADELPPAGELFCPPVGVLSYLQSCTFGAGCHRTVPGSADAAMGLDLGNDALIQATAIGKLAHQTQTGEHADDPDVSPRRFGRAMPLIDPMNPGNSYLLYKTIIGPNAVDPALPPEQAAALAAEIERLRASVVVGMPMPPQPTPTFWLHDPPAGQMIDPSQIVPRVDGGDMDALTAWIAQGAPTHICPPAP